MIPLRDVVRSEGPKRPSLRTTLKLLIRSFSRALLPSLALVASLGCEGRTTVRRAEATASDSVALARRAETDRARQDSIVRSRPGYVIDSILPVEEEIRRFQATIAERPTAFSGGAASRAALVGDFVRALERNDTTALVRLVINRAEFGYLIYPTSPNVAPPYRQSPDLVWMLRSAGTDKARSRLFRRFGGRPLGYAGYVCSDSTVHEGENTLWSGCAVRLVSGETGDTSLLRLFGPIVQRGRTFKFLSLSNGL